MLNTEFETACGSGGKVCTHICVRGFRGSHTPKPGFSGGLAYRVCCRPGPCASPDLGGHAPLQRLAACCGGLDLEFASGSSTCERTTVFLDRLQWISLGPGGALSRRRVVPTPFRS